MLRGTLLSKRHTQLHQSLHPQAIGNRSIQRVVKPLGCRVERHTFLDVLGLCRRLFLPSVAVELKVESALGQRVRAFDAVDERVEVCT